MGCGKPFRAGSLPLPRFFGPTIPKSTNLCTGKERLQLRDQVARSLRPSPTSLGRIQHQADDRRVFRLGHGFREIEQAPRLGDADGKMETMFRKVSQAIQASTAPGEYESRGNLPVQAGAAQIICHEAE